MAAPGAQLWSERSNESLERRTYVRYVVDGTVAELRTLIEDVDIPVSPRGLQEAIALRDRLEARIAVAVGAFDAHHLGDEDCGLNTPSWLRHKVRLDHRSAGRLTAVGRRLHRFPLLRQAALAGHVSGGQLQIVAACVPERHFERFAEHEAVVVAALEALGIEGTTVLLQDWLRKADALDERSPGGGHDNELHLSRTLDARGELRGSFDADRTAAVEAALRIADHGDRDVARPQRRADALDSIINFFLDHHDTSSGRRHRPHVNVVMTEEELVAGEGGTYLDTGQPVSRAAAQVLRCDSFLHRLLVDSEGTILDYGRATREWPADVFNAILARDQGCRFPGCDAPANRCHVHHVREWERDHGETSVWNGMLGCSRHHHLIHRLGLHVKLLPEGSVEITMADGRVERSEPRGPVPRHLFDERRRGGS